MKAWSVCFEHIAGWSACPAYFAQINGMDYFNLLIVVSLFYCALFFLDTVFKTCSHHPYLYFLENTGFHVEVLRIRWFTTVFNRSIQKWGSVRPNLVRGWFTLGSWVSMAMLPMAIYIVSHSTLSILFKSGYTNDSRPVVMMEPMVPGITLPTEDLGYYIATLAICSIVHEMGHALAAVRERVRVFGVGLAVVLVLPVAYVQLSTEQLQALTPSRQLCVMTAGVWHNIVLSGLAVCLSGVLPLLLSPMYATNLGVSVTYLVPGSSLVGATGLNEGDHLTMINDCALTDQLRWQHCIREAIAQYSMGYCAAKEMDTIAETDVEQCCPASEVHHLCFQLLPKKRFSCIRARSIVENAERTCSQASDCPAGGRCLRPVLDNSTKLVRIRRANSPSVLFLGHPADIYHSVKVSEYVPAYGWVSARLPAILTRLCNFVATLSAGLALVNLVPCFWFDGQHIVVALTHLLLANLLSRRAREATALCLTLVGTTLLLLGVLVAGYDVATR